MITGATDRAVLYGAFALLRKIAQGESVSALNEVQVPSAPVRWVNQWDNLDGTIERGYAGQSIFFENGSVRQDLTRAAEYARLLASVGINGCNVSNVNADLHILDADFIPQLARIADVFRPYGVQLGVAVNVGMPKQIGGLETFDPLDPKVAEWWKKKFDEVYRQIPDFGGVVVKADSEGQLGRRCMGASRGSGERDCEGAEAAWRNRFLSRVCLQPSSGLEQPESRSRASRIRQFPSAGRTVRRQRDHADQARAHRFSGA